MFSHKLSHQIQYSFVATEDLRIVTFHHTLCVKYYIQWNLSKMVTELGSHLSKAASLPGPK